MKVECGNCPAKYQIASQRLSGRRVRMRCKRCRASLIVDGRKSPFSVHTEPPSDLEPVSVEADSVDTEPAHEPTGRRHARTILGGMAAPFPTLEERLAPPPRPSLGATQGPAQAPRAARPSPPTEAPQWCVAMAENDTRWMTVAEIRSALEARTIHPRSFVKRRSASHWVHLMDVQELALAVGASEDLLASLPPPVNDPAARGSRPPPRKGGSSAVAPQTQDEAEAVPSSFLTLQNSSEAVQGEAPAEPGGEPNQKKPESPPTVEARAAAPSAERSVPERSEPERSEPERSEPEQNGKVIGVVIAIALVAIAMAIAAFFYQNQL